MLKCKTMSRRKASEFDFSKLKVKKHEKNYRCWWSRHISLKHIFSLATFIAWAYCAIPKNLASRQMQSNASSARSDFLVPIIRQLQSAVIFHLVKFTGKANENVLNFFNFQYKQIVNWSAIICRRKKDFSLAQVCGTIVSTLILSRPCTNKLLSIEHLFEFVYKFPMEARDQSWVLCSHFHAVITLVANVSVECALCVASKETWNRSPVFVSSRAI